MFILYSCYFSYRFLSCFNYFYRIVFVLYSCVSVLCQNLSIIPSSNNEVFEQRNGKSYRHDRLQCEMKWFPQKCKFCFLDLSLYAYLKQCFWRKPSRSSQFLERHFPPLKKKSKIFVIYMLLVNAIEFTLNKDIGVK